MKYGLPGQGVMARTVPLNNGKCDGCLHFDGQLGLAGLCLVGLQPVTCGEGDMPGIGYAPFAGGGSVQNVYGHVMTERAPGEPNVVDGLGNYAAPANQVVHIGLDFDPVVKALCDEQLSFTRSFCPLHQQRAQNSGASSNLGTVDVSCACLPVDLGPIAKSLHARLPNRVRAFLHYGELEEYLLRAFDRVYPAGPRPKPSTEYLPGVHTKENHPYAPSTGVSGMLGRPKAGTPPPGAPKKPKVSIPKLPPPPPADAEAKKALSKASTEPEIPKAARAALGGGGVKNYEAVKQAVRPHVESQGLSRGQHKQRARLHEAWSHKHERDGNANLATVHAAMAKEHADLAGRVKKSFQKVDETRKSVWKGLAELELLLEKGGPSHPLPSPKGGAGYANPKHKKLAQAAEKHGLQHHVDSAGAFHIHVPMLTAPTRGDATGHRNGALVNRVEHKRVRSMSDIEKYV